MIDIGLGHYLTLGAVIFTIGIIGIFLNRKNIIVILMSIELILLSVNINLVSFSIFLNKHIKVNNTVIEFNISFYEKLLNKKTENNLNINEENDDKVPKKKSNELY